MSVAEAANRLASRDFVRIVAHADADGVGAAACLCSALSEAGVGYHFTALDDPADVVSEEADVFCDLGAQYLDGVDGVVIDHHPPQGEPADSVLTGTDAPSSSVAAHRVALRISSGDPVAALVGAIGDSVPIDDVSDIVDELASEDAEVDEGIRLAGDDPVEALTYSTHPFTRLSGDHSAAREFVDGVEDNLPTAVVLLALSNENANPEAAASLVGDVHRLPTGTTVHALSRYVETCAVSGHHGLALSTCLNPGAHLEEARSTWRAFESTLIEEVREARVEDGDPSFAYTDGVTDTGAVADVMRDWVTGDVVVVGENEASFRAEAFDCGRVAREAARAAGGDGGGHESRAGASFDAPRETFVEAVKEALV